jgi:dolichyl-phosphate-mannose-protein mannosyltransferase/glycosyl transferase family 22 (putative mannosyltransferase)
VLAGLLRLVAAICSGGFLASDDHHVVIGAADQIASGAGLPVTYARSALLPGVIAGIMSVTRGSGIHDPGNEMLIVRLVQALYSLCVVYFIYRMLDRELGRQSALLGGILAAAFYAMPVTAVHQLEESVCQVPLLAACWWWMRRDESWTWGGAAGAALGTALVLRLPLIGFVAAFVSFALLQRTSVQGKLALLGGLALVVVLQGFSNSLINHQWGYSFAQRLGPMLHPQRMALEAEGYPNRPPWQYVLTLLAALIPPVSILLLAAAVKGGIRFQHLAIATLVFLVSHSLIANKQERFILPILPLLFVLIVAGLPWLAERIGGRAYRGMWWYFGVVNAVLVILLTFSFSKKDRVAPLLYVYRRHDATGVLVAQFNQTFGVPIYYLGKPAPAVTVLGSAPTALLPAPLCDCNYVILYSDTPETDRALLAQALHRPLTYVTTITPSLSDRLAHAINPRHNKAHTAVIYTTT